MRARIERLKETLRRQDLAALMCGRPANVLALSGYWPVVGNSIAAITREGATGLLVPEDEEDLAKAAGVNTVATFKAASLSHLEPTTEAIGDALGGLATRLDCPTGRFGHDAGACTQPVTYAALFDFGTALPDLLRKALNASDTVDFSHSLDLLRATLTPHELAHVKQACAAAKAGFETAKRRIRIGMREREIGMLLASSISAASEQVRAGAFGFCMSGPNSADACRAYQMPGRRALQKGDVALLHTNSFVNGCWTDITRTYCFNLNGRYAAVQHAILNATSAALQTIHPGVRGCDVDEAARSVMRDAGYGEQFKHATGHGVGLNAIDHNARPRIHPKSDDVLESGMVFNVEPAAYFAGEFGIRQCNMVAVTDTGCELLTAFDSTIDQLVITG